LDSSCSSVITYRGGVSVLAVGRGGFLRQSSNSTGVVHQASEREVLIKESVALSFVDDMTTLVRRFYDLLDQKDAKNRGGNLEITYGDLSELRDNLDRVSRLTAKLGVFTADTPYWVATKEVGDLVEMRLKERVLSVSKDLDNSASVLTTVEVFVDEPVFREEMEDVLTELSELTPLSLGASLIFRKQGALFMTSKPFFAYRIDQISGDRKLVEGQDFLQSYKEYNPKDDEGTLETTSGMVGESRAIIKTMSRPLRVGGYQIATLNVVFLLERRMGDRAFDYPSWRGRTI
jgi:hypothetical protein